MNVVILLLLTAGIAASLLSGGGDGVLAALQDGTANAVETVFRTSGAYLLWMGLLNVAKQAGLVRALSRLLSPVLGLLFPDAGGAKEAISLNLAANMLGMGNAATPYGLDAMRLLNEANPHPGVATNAMCVLLAVNASCLEVFPATLVGLRQSCGSTDPASVVLPTLLSSLAATFVAVLLCLAFTRPCRSRS
ncbi:MAG: nucleoside recognition protein [Clostridia bacterium]|nr:nucleoside recognition protein [Clostridia bacterium]